ncbi:hypothetical protein ACFQ10_53570 [Streptomyces indonesiensis]
MATAPDGTDHHSHRCARCAPRAHGRHPARIDRSLLRTAHRDG